MSPSKREIVSPPDKKGTGGDGTNTLYHCWYSYKQEQIRRQTRTYSSGHRREGASIYWNRPNGERVEVTLVSLTPEHGCNAAVIDDLVYRGTVCMYSGVCQY